MPESIHIIQTSSGNQGICGIGHELLKVRFDHVGFYESSNCFSGAALFRALGAVLFWVLGVGLFRLLAPGTALPSTRTPSTRNRNSTTPSSRPGTWNSTTPSTRNNTTPSTWNTTAAAQAPASIVGAGAISKWRSLPLAWQRPGPLQHSYFRSLPYFVEAVALTFCSVRTKRSYFRSLRSRISILTECAALLKSL